MKAVVRIFTLSQALAVVLMLAPHTSYAAGLGRLTVQSGLGQPLSAEIDLVAVRGDEASSLEARLASPDAYQKANLQYNSGIVGIKLSIEKRVDGQSYLKLTGSRPFSEPFVNLLIELTWSGSRLMREYTVLLDPPGYGQQAQAAAAPSAPAPKAETRPIAAPAPALAPAASVAAAAQEYGPIAKGETLSQIAAGLKPEGVSLEQMLLGLFRSNPNAFIRNNMNLVKAGKILRVPDAQKLAAITQGEAVKEYRTQVSDWRAYVARVAEATGTTTAEGSRTVRGRITTQDGAGAAAGDKDLVKLSKGEPVKGGTSAARAQTLQEELVARNKELATANDRIVQLEKTIKDMQKLAELKSPGLAAAQKKGEATKDAKKTEAAKPATKPEFAPKADMKGADVARSAEAKKDGEAMTPPAEKPSAATKPKTKPKVVAPPPPPPEPSVMDNLPVIGGGILALVLGGAAFAALRSRRARVQDDAGDVEPVVAPTVSFEADIGAKDQAAPAADARLDFKIDFGDLNINLDDTSTTAAPAEGKDSHWYDVQQKFDLAKAYQEMGDNDGAKGILLAVINEGDAEQQKQAQKLLSTLG